MGREISEMTTFTSEDRQAAQKEMNNKPVAWMLKTGHGTKILEVKPYCEVDYWIPLYTHPANACKHGVDDGACKECYLEATHTAGLTDEEITAIWQTDECYQNAQAFARAILRKASE